MTNTHTKTKVHRLYPLPDTTTIIDDTPTTVVLPPFPCSHLRVSVPLLSRPGLTSACSTLLFPRYRLSVYGPQQSYHGYRGPFYVLCWRPGPALSSCIPAISCLFRFCAPCTDLSRFPMYLTYPLTLSTRSPSAIHDKCFSTTLLQ